MSSIFTYPESRELVRRIVAQTAVPEETVKKILGHQFDSLIDALRHNNSVEISGFGKFILSPNKVNSKKKLYEGRINGYRKKADNPDTPPDVRERLLRSALFLEKDYNELKERTNGLDANSGRVEKQSVPSKRTKRKNSGSGPSENNNLPELQ